MDPRSQKIWNILKKYPELMCVDVINNKLYVLVDDEMLLCLSGPDFLKMSDTELKEFVRRMLDA